MRRRTTFMSILLVLAAASCLWAWGYRVHHTVTGAAVDLLPEPLRRFYGLNRPMLVYHSTDPDVWSDMKIKTPASAHYIDIDLLEPPPFDDIPRTRKQAVARYGEAKLRKAGTLPWEITRRTHKLTQAFREKRWEDVILQSSWISHFIADATMPLHTTKNYKGQESGNIILEAHGPNRTVHHRLEWGLPEHLPEVYDNIMGDAAEVKHVDDVSTLTWTTVFDSFGYIDAVLDADKTAAELDDRFGDDYYRKFDELMRPLVRERLERSEELIACVWLTCWEDAGRPELPMYRVRIELSHIEDPAKVEGEGATELLVPLVSLMAGVAGLILGSQLTLAVLRRQRG